MHVLGADNDLHLHRKMMPLFSLRGLGMDYRMPETHHKRSGKREFMKSVKDFHVLFMGYRTVAALEHSLADVQNLHNLPYN